MQTVVISEKSVNASTPQVVSRLGPKGAEVTGSQDPRSVNRHSRTWDVTSSRPKLHGRGQKKELRKGR